MRRNLVIGGALAAVLVLVAGVTVAVSPTVRQQLGLSDPPAAATQAEPIPGADLSGTGPGSLISAMTMPEFSRSPQGSQISAARVVYRSTDGDTGAPTEVSGSDRKAHV